MRQVKYVDGIVTVILFHSPQGQGGPQLGIYQECLQILSLKLTCTYTTYSLNTHRILANILSIPIEYLLDIYSIASAHLLGN